MAPVTDEAILLGSHPSPNSAAMDRTTLRPASFGDHRSVGPSHTIVQPSIRTSLFAHVAGFSLSRDPQEANLYGSSYLRAVRRKEVKYPSSSLRGQPLYFCKSKARERPFAELSESCKSHIPGSVSSGLALASICATIAPSGVPLYRVKTPLISRLPEAP